MCAQRDEKTTRDRNWDAELTMHAMIYLSTLVHLSEPPIALIVGILLGPAVLQWLTPNFCDSEGCGSEFAGGWGWVSWQTRSCRDDK